MTDKITLTNLSSGYQSVAQLNANFQSIEDALNNSVLWRDDVPSGADNTISNEIDMNSNRLRNLPAPESETDAARWIDVTESLDITASTVPALSGQSGKVLSNNGTALTWAAQSVPDGSVTTAKIVDANVTYAKLASAAITTLFTSPTIASPTITGTPKATVYALSGTTPVLEPDNGSIQTWTLTGNSIPTDGFAAGEAITVMVNDGTAYTVTWPSVTWVNNAGIAPTLATTGYTVVVLWKVSTTLYGALVGNGT